MPITLFWATLTFVASFTEVEMSTALGLHRPRLGSLRCLLQRNISQGCFKNFLQSCFLPQHRMMLGYAGQYKIWWFTVSPSSFTTTTPPTTTYSPFTTIYFSLTMNSNNFSPSPNSARTHVMSEHHPRPVPGNATLVSATSTSAGTLDTVSILSSDIRGEAKRFRTGWRI